MADRIEFDDGCQHFGVCSRLPKLPAVVEPLTVRFHFPRPAPSRFVLLPWPEKRRRPPTIHACTSDLTAWWLKSLLSCSQHDRHHHRAILTQHLISLLPQLRHVHAQPCILAVARPPGFLIDCACPDARAGLFACCGLVGDWSIIACTPLLLEPRQMPVGPLPDSCRPLLSWSRQPWSQQYSMTAVVIPPRVRNTV